MTAIRPLTGPHAWVGRDIAGAPCWVRDLGRAQTDDLDAALESVSRRGLAWDRVGPDDCPLPSWRALVADIREELENGSGMVRLRGFPVGRYALDDLRRLYFGLGRHIGTPRPQNRHGEMMRTIRDEGAEVGKRYGEMNDGTGTFLSSYARSLSSGPLRFHTDRCDVVTLLCVNQAARGGHSKLASIAAIHNAMLARRPDLVELLYGDYWRSRLGEEEGGEAIAYALPVFGVRDGRLTSHYSRTFVEAAQRLPDVPRLSALQNEALDMLAALAEELCFEMSLAPGDLQLVNNHAIYHARAGFEDDSARGKARMLLRLWLSMPNSRPLPENHAVLWGAIEAGAVRGGIGAGA